MIYIYLFLNELCNLKMIEEFPIDIQVVSRGGFYVGNGINWKGQVFSKMRNHTISNRMTVCLLNILLFLSYCNVSNELICCITNNSGN